MQEKTSSKESFKNKENPMAEIAEQTVKNCEQALHTGLKFQQEAGQWWSKVFDQATSVEDWQKRFSNFNSLANSLRPATQKRLDEVLDLVEKNTRTGTELLKKATDAAQTPAIADSHAKWMDVWTSSLGAVRSNAEAVMQINARAMDTLIDFVQKNADIAQVRSSKAA